MIYFIYYQQKDSMYVLGNHTASLHAGTRPCMHHGYLWDKKKQTSKICTAVRC